MGVWSRLNNSYGGIDRSAVSSKVAGSVSGSRGPSHLNVNNMKMAFDSFSQPVWGPEIATLGAYAREGYTSKTFDVPFIPFSTQKMALQVDEDVQLAINDLASRVTGSEHYWKAIDDQVAQYMSDFSHDIHFDILDTELVKEVLWYGNSVYKPRLGVQYIRNMDDLMHIPISSFTRIWWDRQRIPYKYEFRGPEYQGYHNPSDIIHIKWNPVNASAFGTGFGVSMTSPRAFSQITPGGPVDCLLPSILDRKYSTQLTMHITERRYIPHNVYVMPSSSADERAAARADLVNLTPGEDIVVGTQTEVQELGSMQRAFNPAQWAELTVAPILKAMNDFRGKNSGESGHQYANAKTAALLDEIGLASFPAAVITQLVEFLFEPWYDNHPLYSMNYGGGLVSMPWKECKYELNFGRVEKKDLPPEILIQFLDFGLRSGALNDPVEIRDIMEDAGLGLRKENTAMMNSMYHDTNVMPPSFGQQNNFSTYGADHAPRPQDSPQYNDHDNPTPRFPSKIDQQPSDPRLNFSVHEMLKRNTKVSSKPFR